MQRIRFWILTNYQTVFLQIFQISKYITKVNTTVEVDFKWKLNMNQLNFILDNVIIIYPNKPYYISNIKPDTYISKQVNVTCFTKENNAKYCIKKV